MTGSNPTNGITFSGASSGQTAAGTGAINFPLSFPGGVTGGSVNITETQQTDYTMVQNAGLNATCVNTTTGAAISGVTNSGAAGVTVPVSSTDPVTCTFSNRSPQPPATVVLNKSWNINGQVFAEGTQPSDLVAQAVLAGNNVPWGVAQSGFRTGDRPVINEPDPNLSARVGCRLVSKRLTASNGATVDLALPYTPTLVQGANTFTITNTLECVTSLTLVKTATGGVTAPNVNDWTLISTRPNAGNLPGPTGTTGVTASVTPGVRYLLSETGGDPAYRQFVDPNATITPGATGSWTCVSLNAAGGVIPGFSDGLNGGVIAPLGTRIRCTTLNQTAQLRLVKEVVNDNGGTAVPANWNLTATPTGSFPAGLPTQTRTGASVGDAVSFNVRPGVVYNLTESGGPAGYDLTNIQCQVVAPRSEVTSIQLAAGEAGTCYFINNDRPATLTLVKVVNNAGGGTATPANWTLSAAGPTPVIGPGNSALVTNRTVSAGTYALSETGGPAGYTASNWACTGGSLSGTNVTVANGANVTCTITNTAQQARLTLIKTVTNDNGGTATPAQWNLTATGPTTGINGVTGSAAVTNVAVAPGSYTLGETGPTGYTAGAWVCTGGTVTGSSVTVVLGANVSCTINNNDNQARLTLVKIVNNGSTGSPVGPANFTLDANGPTPVSGPGGSAAVTNQPVNAGTYALSETGLAGYTASAWSCTGGTLTGSNVVVPTGGNVTCTIINTTVPPRLTLVKVVDNGTSGATNVPANWTLSAVNGGTTVTGPGNSAAVTNQTVPIGTYNLSETGPTGYTASSWVCTGGASTTGTSVTLALGSNAACTITNTAGQPRLTLVKTVTNDNGGTAVPTAWTLTAAGPTTTVNGAVGSANVTNAAVPVGDYTLSETGPTGYTASAWTCTGATQRNNVVVITTGTNATCTINNDDQPAILTLVKVVDNGSTGAAFGPADFTLDANGPTPVSGPGNSPAVTNQTVDAGAYELSESGPPGYTTSGWDCVNAAELNGATVTIANGANVTCIINNRAVAPRLTLIKTVDNGNTGATTPPTAWTLTAENGDSTITGATGTGPVTGAPAIIGTYNLSEAGGPDGYTDSDWVCTGATSHTADSVTLALSQDATCTITNTAQQPRLTLVKRVENNYGGSAVATDWTLEADGPTPVEGTTGVSQDVAIGDYELAETGGPGGYAPSAWDCGDADLDGANLTVGLGVDITCIITNRDRPARLTLVKNVQGGDSGSTAEPADWTLTATRIPPIAGQDPVSGNGDPESAGGVNDVEVFSGTYNLAEDGPAGFEPGDEWVCEGGAVSEGGDAVTIPSGGNVRCTITNTPIVPRLTLVKEVVNDNGGTAVPTDWELSADGPSPISGETGAITVTNAAVRVGEYSLGEDGPGGYDASAWDCGAKAVDDGNRIRMREGDVVTCTITNDDIAPAWNIRKASNPVSGSTVQPGEDITYTVTATKAAGVNPTNVVVNDDLSQVLNNATLVGAPTASVGTVAVTGTTLTWNIPTLAAAETVTYTVRVNDGAYGVTLRNAVTSPGSSPCVPDEGTGARVVAAAVDDPCPTTTTHRTPAWSLHKSSDPRSGSTVQPGSRVVYTLTARNTADARLTGAVVTDDLTAVLAYGRLVSVPAGATLSGTTLTWAVPTLESRGDTARLRYTVVVDSDAYDVSFANVATPGPGGVCEVCSTNHRTPPKPVPPIPPIPPVPPVPPVPPLPPTGGPGILPLALGILLLIGAGVTLLISRRGRRT